jgi:curli biogenesis system outer membrane secretion channel CsgG
VRRVPSKLLVVALAVAGGCSSQNRYVSPTADLGDVKTVAILPFESVTSDKLAADRVQKIFFTELLATGAFQVVEPGQVAFVMRRERIGGEAALTNEDLKKLGQALRAEAFFMGAVIEYDDGRGGPVPTPRVKLLLRLVEAATGETVWSVGPSRTGATVAARLFGIGGAPASVVAEELIRRELAQLTR